MKYINKSGVIAVLFIGVQLLDKSADCCFAEGKFGYL